MSHLSVPRAVGSRITVKEVITELSLVKRGELSGITVITDERNVPPPTEGVIVSVGADPLLAEEGLVVGAHVFYGKHAGTYVMWKGEQYRTLGFSEVINVLSPEEVANEVEDKHNNDISSLPVSDGSGSQLGDRGEGQTGQTTPVSDEVREG